MENAIVQLNKYPKDKYNVLVPVTTMQVTPSWGTSEHTPRSKRATPRKRCGRSSPRASVP